MERLKKWHDIIQAYHDLPVGSQPVGSVDHEGGARMRMEVVILKRILGSMCF